ncbi:hypothetical protein NEF87_004925 [Candidatus Lokiarchaeum ossiferum]|uniref:Uncharacterized protein n=1 Tax=Candidatus Lokiarchaeum ossiferum TaxID=2951803 RepID=A0ABY6HYM7_9ARCH|nr:hypothetical protein NEF87_004925 [Candidatus Lokiarchaeum sp. B-35]
MILKNFTKKRIERKITPPLEHLISRKLYQKSSNTMINANELSWFESNATFPSLKYKKTPIARKKLIDVLEAIQRDVIQAFRQNGSK